MPLHDLVSFWGQVTQSNKRTSTKRAGFYPVTQKSVMGFKYSYDSVNGPIYDLDSFIRIVLR